MNDVAAAENLILIGFMGAGKTTVGEALAQQAGFRFIDLDAEITRLAGRSIPEIFSREGEESFRDLETQALTLVAAQQHIVLATGGGVVLRPGNWELMRKAGRIIYLQVPWETLQERLSFSFARPLVRPERGWEETRLLYEKRLPLYQQADWVVEGDQDCQQVVDKILGIARIS
jgi:shikimate kinase